MTLKILAIIYGICLIPTLVAVIAWPDEHRKVLEGKLGSFIFFISAWLASPFILSTMLINKLRRK